MKEYSILELQELLKNGKLTSVELCQMYIDEIARIDQDGPKLNSIAEINPDVIEIAKSLDKERKATGPRSLMHGIPVVLKDNINTKDKMHTSASSLALADFYAPYEATVVKKLREAGAIILGKANLSEFAYFMSYDDMPSGYGSRFGQVKCPYSDKIDPLGSSTGSAVSVASNLTTVAIGTETNGSLTAPAQNNSIVSMKPTLGMVSRTGIIPISHLQDTAGPMGRNVEDVAILLDAIVGKDELDNATDLIPDSISSFSRHYKEPISDLRLGFLMFDNGEYEEDEIKIMQKAKEVLEPLVKHTIDLKPEEADFPNHKTLEYEFKVDLNYYFSTVKGHTPINSLKELIEYNKQDPENRIKYGQSIFEAAEATSGTLKEPEYIKLRKELLEKANLMNDLMKERDLDVIVMCRRTSHAPIAGNPIITVPAKALTDDLPRSVFFVARNFEDIKCIQVAYQYENATKFRIPPTFK